MNCQNWKILLINLIEQKPELTKEQVEEQIKFKKRKDWCRLSN